MKRLKFICKTLTFVCALLLAPSRLQAGAFDDANRAFADGRFAEAAKGYEAILHEKGYSAPVLYNLANTYFREGQIGRAILNYDRAQLLAPDDPDISANLNFARKEAGLFVEQNSWMTEAAGCFGMDEWWWLGSVMLFATCALIVTGRVYPAQRLYFRLFTAIAVVTLLAAGGAIVLQLNTLHRAVVTAKEAVVRISPFASAKSAFVLAAGDEVDVEKAHEGFLLVEHRDHRVGWVSGQQVEPVVPPGKG